MTEYSSQLKNRLLSFAVCLPLLMNGVTSFTHSYSTFLKNSKINEPVSSKLSLRMSSSSSSELSRRQIGELVIAGVGLGGSYLATRENKPTDYGLFGILPVGPYKTKKSVFETLEEGQLWTVTQKFGILDVQVPLRMTIIKLKGEGLFIYDPVAATPEVVSYIRELEKLHGPVKHIVVGSVVSLL